MGLQEEFDEKRAKYMDREISHHDFYCWVADSIGVGIQHIPVTVEEIREALTKDEYLNNIVLDKWDRKNGIVSMLAFNHGIKAWSLSNTVCVLKAVARRAALQLGDH